MKVECGTHFTPVPRTIGRAAQLALNQPVRFAQKSSYEGTPEASKKDVLHFDVWIPFSMIAFEFQFRLR